MFSFRTPSADSDSYPIAHVKGGHRNGEVLWLYWNEYNLPESSADRAQEGYFDSLRLTDGELIPMPPSQERQRSCALIVAPSGVGKSTFIANWMRNFYDVFPDHGNSVLFTQNTELDPAFHDLANTIDHTVIDNTILMQPVLVNDLADGHDKLVIFDDYRTNVAKVREAVDKLRNQVAEVGRKLKLHVIIASTDAPVRTALYRDLLTNCTEFIYFPQRSPGNIKRVLEGYLDVPDRLRLDLRKWDTRFIIISRGSIPYILGQHTAIIYNPDREMQRLKQEIAAGKIATKPIQVKTTFLQQAQYDQETEDLAEAARQLRQESKARRTKAASNPILKEHARQPEINRRVSFKENLLVDEPLYLELEELIYQLKRVEEDEPTAANRMKARNLKNLITKYQVTPIQIEARLQKITVPKKKYAISERQAEDAKSAIKNLTALVNNSFSVEAKLEGLAHIETALETLAKYNTIEVVDKLHRDPATVELLEKRYNFNPDEIDEYYQLVQDHGYSNYQAIAEVVGYRELAPADDTDEES